VPKEIDEILARRSRRVTGARRYAGLVASFFGHVSLGAAFVVAPALAARNRPPIEFTRVQIVPVQALGVVAPEPRRTAPAKPASKPEPPKPAPKPVEEKKTVTHPAPATKPADTRQAVPDDSAPAAEGPQQRQGSPLGSTKGGSSFGAVAGFDNPDFVYNYYVEQMLSLIGAHWVRPPVGGGVEAIVRFRIGTRGEVTEVELLESSGHTTFDLAGLRAIQQASPLPPLPRSYPHDSLGVRLVIR
jgi:TonB family protein